jgi:hypothetical protein
MDIALKIAPLVQKVRTKKLEHGTGKRLRISTV